VSCRREGNAHDGKVKNLSLNSFSLRRTIIGLGGQL
jgi:hypothetical protein